MLKIVKGQNKPNAIFTLFYTRENLQISLKISEDCLNHMLNSHKRTKSIQKIYEANEMDETEVSRSKYFIQNT